MSTDAERIEILLIEPNPGDTRLFSEKFRDAKLTNDVHSVTDGDSALDFLHQRGEYADAPRPDLILLEPRLPGKSGIDVLSELDDDPEVSDVPVFVMTSSDAGERIIRTHDLEADHYIRKPVEPAEFVEFVQSVEDFWVAIVQRSSARD